MLNLNLLSALYNAALQANDRFNLDDPVWEESRQLEARMKAFEASLTEEQKREFDDLIADHDHAREKGAFIIGFETAWNMIHHPEKAASIFQGCNASEAADYLAYVVSNAIEN